MRGHDDRAAASAVVLHVRHRLSQATRSSQPLRVGPDGAGICIGRDQCHLDPLVAATHGTLERTPQHGVWVYVDHSDRGSLLNQKLLLHRDAAVVRDGDVLSVGNTDITLRFQDDKPGSPRSDNQQPHSPPPSSSASLAKQQLPNITTRFQRPQPQQQQHPEYINSPTPAPHWRKKRHSISHVTTRIPLSLTGATSTSQVFARPKPLVPSAPSTPPQKDGPARPVSHHVATLSPQSPYYHVKWKDEPETTLTESTDADDREDQQPRDDDGDDDDAQPTSTKPRPPPLEYSSSPLTTTTAPSFLNRREHSPSTGPASGPAAVPRPSPPPAAAIGFHQFDGSTSKPSSRPVDLRIQVAKRNATAAVASGAARPLAPGSSTTTSTTGTPTTRPATLSRGITIPTSTAHSSPSAAAKEQSPQRTHRRFHSGLEGFTPPASPVAHQDILRQKQSLLNILKSKYKEEQKLKREQEEWMRSQFPTAAAAATVGAVPSMSPIRHGPEDAASKTELDGNDGDEELAIPTKAPALLRTVSLGHTVVQHQPSPRLTAAVLASRAARKGLHRHEHPNQSPRRTVAGSETAMHRVSNDSSVTSSVSTEPAVHRRVTRSLSFTSSRGMASSGELSDFAGYDDDDDGPGALMSFTSFFGPTSSSWEDPLVPEAIKREATVATPNRRARSRRQHRVRAPSLDDETVGVLNSPSHRHSDPPAGKRLFGRRHHAQHQLGISSARDEQDQ